MRVRILGAAAGLLFTVGTIAGNEMADSGDASGDSASVALANIRSAYMEPSITPERRWR